MSYVKNTWQTGDTITATGLNHMEDGIAEAGGGGGLTVTFTTEDSGMSYTADKTYAEVYNALSNRIPVMGYVGASGGTYQPIPFTGGYHRTVGGVESGRVSFLKSDIYPSDMYMEVTEMVIDLNNTVTCTKSEFSLTPYE